MVILNLSKKTFRWRTAALTQLQASKAINEFDELLETGFKGREVALVEKMLVELDAIEQDTDDMQIKIRQELRQVEADLNPIDAMFLYRSSSG